MTAMTNKEASVSTFGKTSASRTTYCKDVAALDDPATVLFDFMDRAYIKAVYALPAMAAVTWRERASLAALSYDFYGTTDHGPTILLFNGYISASHIPAGATVNLPDVSSLNSQLRKSNKGKVVRV